MVSGERCFHCVSFVEWLLNLHNTSHTNSGFFPRLFMDCTLAQAYAPGAPLCVHRLLTPPTYVHFEWETRGASHPDFLHGTPTTNRW